jgi:hypothetical protein
MQLVSSTPRFWRELIDSCQNFDTRRDVLVSKIFLTKAGCGAVSLIGRDGLDIHGYRNRGRLENGDHHSRIRIGPESAIGYVRTDIESGDKADAKQGTAYQPSPQE